MDVLAEIVGYHAGERMIGIMATGMGLAALAAAVVVFVRRKDAVGRGLLVPLLLMALGGTIGGPILAAKSAERVETFAQRYEAAPAELATEELQRMERVNGNWLPLKVMWGSLAGISVIVIVRLKRPFWSGVAVGLIPLCVLLFIGDTIFEGRAERYTKALESIPR